MKNYNFTFKLFLMMIMVLSGFGVIQAAETVTIPTATGTYIDWSKATLTNCSSENNGANIGSTHNGSTAVFTLQNNTEQDYLLTFLSGAKNLSAVVSLTITDGDGYNVSKQFDCTNTKSWTPSEVHNAIFSNVPAGELTMTFKVESTTGSYAGNYGNLSLVSTADFGLVPGGIDLNSGTYSNCQTESGGNVGYIREGSTATYNINVTKAGKYNFSWDVTRYNGTTVDVAVYNYATGTTELSKSLTIAELTNYANDVQELGELTTGAKRLTLTFHCSSGYVCNYKNLALRYAGTDISYYSFSYDVVGGLSSLVTMSASPSANSYGKYEEGTLITLTAADNPLFHFLHWADDDTTNPRSYRMTQDITETATYETTNGYLAGWDFSKGYGAAPDYAEREENESSSLYLLNADGSKASGSYWNQGGSARIWRDGELDYVARLNAQNYKNITLQSQLSYSYNVWPTTTIQYSLDGTTWTNVDGASITFTASDRNKWIDLNATLPSECNHAETLYIRWASQRVSDGEGGYDTSSMVGTASSYRALQIREIYVLGDYEIYNDQEAPSLISFTPNNGAQHVKREGTVTMSFNKNVLLLGKAELNGQQLDGEVLGSRITFPYSGLDSNTEYTFTLPAGSISNENNVANADAITITFKTVARQTVATKKAFDFVVGTDGTADEAMAAANASTADRYYIFVPDGQWEMQGNTTGAGKKTNVQKTVSIIGQSRDGAVLWNDDESEDGWGISTTSTLNLQGEHSYLQDITLKNWRGQGDTQKGVAVALSEKGYNIYKNVAIWGNQDTYVSAGTNYWEGGQICGSVDYICGAGNIWFEGTELLNTRAGSVITAPRTEETEQWGYVFNNCSIGSYYNSETVTSGLNSICENGGYTFGRPWQSAPRTTMLNTICNVLPSDAGWQGMGNNLAFHFNEFGSVSRTGRPLDLSGRSVAGVNQDNPECDTDPVLTQAEAATFTLDAVMGSDFIPTQYTEQCEAPVVTLSESTLSWTDDPYALCYVIFKDGEYIDNVTDAKYSITEDGNYTVRAANEMGGLGAESNTTIVTAIKGITSDELSDASSVKNNSQLFNIAGQRVSKSYKGIVIVGGKKYIQN